MGKPEIERAIVERQHALDSAEMAALCAVIARRALPSPYGGTGYVDGQDLHAAEVFESVAAALVVKAETVWREATEGVSSDG